MSYNSSNGRITLTPVDFPDTDVFFLNRSNNLPVVADVYLIKD